MATAPLTLPLPPPWKPGTSFDLGDLGPITYLVGPNGSGKSRFIEVLKSRLSNARFLGADRLVGMQPSGWPAGAPFTQGIARQQFQQVKQNWAMVGAGIDAFVLIEERLALRVRVEATLRQLFDRRIRLEWDSGNLIPRARLGAGAEYRLDRDECHGIRELLVLLTHLYDEGRAYLLIDEPELNLHPQYQSFFMQEVRRVAMGADGAPGKKVVLATHSPFILDLRTPEDLRSVISFAADFRPPARVPPLGTAREAALRPLLPRLNAHHKQLFFSDTPIFVEGIRDARLVTAIRRPAARRSPAPGAA